MFKTLEVATSAIIVVGAFAVAYVVYTELHAAIYDPALPHDVLWRVLFSPAQ